MYLLYTIGDAKPCADGIKNNKGAVIERINAERVDYLDRKYFNTWEEAVTNFYSLVFYCQQLCHYDTLDPLYKVQDNVLMIAGLRNRKYNKNIVFMVVNLDHYDDMQDTLAKVEAYTCGVETDNAEDFEDAK